VNGKIAKKIRKEVKHTYKEALGDLMRLPWYLRVKWAWYIVTHPL
jgi:hypothetical protein